MTTIARSLAAPSAIARRAALRQLLQRAAAMPHSGRSFLTHLIGTYRVLVAWRQPPSLCAAGLLHSAYATESYPHALVAPSHRDVIRAIVGADAEHLIHAFCAIDRAALWRLHAARAPHDRRPLRLRAREGDVVVLEASDVRALVLLECANLAEQCCAPDGGPAPWMARVLTGWDSLVGWRGRVARRGDAIGERHTIAEHHAITAYRRGLAHASRTAAAADFERASRHNPYAGEPHILRALCLDSTAEATRSAGRGAQLLAAWGVPWDKRLPLHAWQVLAMRARTRRRAHDHAAVIAALAGQRPPPWLQTHARERIVIRLPGA